MSFGWIYIVDVVMLIVVVCDGEDDEDMSHYR